MCKGSAVWYCFMCLCLSRCRGALQRRRGTQPTARSPGEETDGEYKANGSWESSAGCLCVCGMFRSGMFRSGSQKRNPKKMKPKKMLLEKIKMGVNCAELYVRRCIFFIFSDAPCPGPCQIYTRIRLQPWP